MFGFSNYSTGSEHYDDSNKVLIGKMKGKTGDVSIKEFVELNLKM